MDIIQLVGICFVVTVLVMVIKEQKPIFAFLLTLFTGVLIFIFLLDQIRIVVVTHERLAEKTEVNTVFLKTILKIIGVAYIAEFGAQVVRDSGQESIASKIELAGKMLIMVMAVPIITVIIETVLKLLPA